MFVSTPPTIPGSTRERELQLELVLQRERPVGVVPVVDADLRLPHERAGRCIERVDVAHLAGVDDQLAPVRLGVDRRELHVPVVEVVRDGLEVPLELPCLPVERHRAVGVEAPARMGESDRRGLVHVPEPEVDGAVGRNCRSVPRPAPDDLLPDRVDHRVERPQRLAGSRHRARRRSRRRAARPRRDTRRRSRPGAGCRSRIRSRARRPPSAEPRQRASCSARAPCPSWRRARTRTSPSPRRPCRRQR